jgi:Na+-transporting NADH:ubiquinone oxidoreductase subunit C
VQQKAPETEAPSRGRGGPLAAFLAMPNERPVKTIAVAVVLCLVCSVVVSSAAVLLKPLQQLNQARAVKTEILKVAGLWEEGKDVDQLFEQIDTRIVNLADGSYMENMDPRAYDQRKAARDPAQNLVIPPDQDIARIKTRARYATVYQVKEGSNLELVILPVHGYGLWSTMYGFLALDGDGHTIQGITFYEHAETAGLGSEIENPAWRKTWIGKKILDETGKVRFQLVKGGVDPASPDARYQVDGLSGATLTADGVTHMMQYWLSDQGFGPYLAKLQESR